MLMKRTALTMGILLVVGIFLVISPQPARAQKVAAAVQTLDYDKDTGMNRAYEFFATQGMKAETFQGKVPLIFGETQNMHCVISLYPLNATYEKGAIQKRTVAFIAVAHNDRNEARKMRDMIRYHMMH